MKAKAVGLTLILLFALQFLNPDLRNVATGSSSVVGSQLVYPSVFFPEAIPPFCPRPQTDLQRSRFESPTHLTITINDHRSWVTNAFEAWLDLNENNAIADQFKKNYDATILLTYADGHHCADQARVRLHGDWRDHLRPGHDGIETSLDVRLATGHLGGIVDFKLFLPETRYGDNEVFATTLVEELGLLSPRTFYIDTTVNGVEVRYLLQEKFRKELLEHRRIPESPIFQGDERFGHGWTSHKDSEDVKNNPRVFWTSRLSNPSFAEGGPVARTIVEEGLSRLNQVYAQVALAEESSTTGDGAAFSRILTDTGLPIFGGLATGATEAEKYTALLLAIGDDGNGDVHGLVGHNQRFVYDPWLGIVQPIYYDGNVQLIKRHLPMRPKLREWFKDLVGVPDHQAVVTQRTAQAAADLRKELALIEFLPFSRTLIDRGTEITKQEFVDLVGPDGTIDRNLQVIAVAGDLTTSDTVPAELFAGFQDPSIRLVFGSLPTGRFTVCELGAQECRLLSVSPEEQVSLLRGGLRVGDADYLYVGNSHSDYREGILQPDRLNAGWEHRNLVGSTTLSTLGDVEIDLDLDGRILELVADEVRARAVIWNGGLDGWTISFRAADVLTTAGPSATDRHDFRGVTGCLTFRDVELWDLSVSVRGGDCEDSIHFLRASGDVVRIDVQSARSDAVDMDFSDLSVSDLVVDGAGNDCLDLSAGSYTILRTRLERCVDKAVSLGESADGEFNHLLVTSSAVGVASKDSSSATVHWADFDDVEVCATVYRKKQAFSGGSLVLERSSCDSEDYRQQDGSMLRVGTL